ncbi:LysR family transcriptional regulator [Oceaniglobus roseus]|uniref:LysR family transcriptional regulator n=1 Tax=Oceaniglobus roseus TaxID=1737570 RepID=UPI000C7EBC19|nr:LysR family transcriptional regulator [Kandeliimicrobium roseum]
MPLRITLRQLEYFIAVCDAGSIARAAQALNVSSPTISTAIAQLEAELGLTLFIRRHAHGLAVSQVGRRFLVGARETVASARGLGDLAATLAGTVRGELHVGCLLTFAQVVLPRLRRSFVDAYPEVSFHQHERDQSELFDRLRDARLDVALTYDLDIPPDLVFLPLIDLPPVAHFAQSHPLAGRSEVSLDDLVGLPMVLLDLPASSDYFLSLFSGLHRRPRIVERTRDIAVMRSLVANGFGYSIANFRPVTDRAPDGGALCFVPISGNPRPLKMGVLMCRGADSSRSVAAFVEHVRAQMDPPGAFSFRTPDT